MPGVLYLPLVTAAVALGLAALVVAPAPRRRLNQAFGAGMAAFAIQESCRFAAMSDRAGIPVETWASWTILAALLLPAPWIVFARHLGRAVPLPARGRRHTLPAVLGVLAAVAAARASELFVVVAGGPTPHLTITTAGTAACAAAIAATVVPLMMLETALRNSGGRDRWRIKLVVVGLFAALSAQIFGLSQAILYAAPQPHRAAPESAQLLLAFLFLAAGQLRYRLLLTDLYIPRRTAYRGLTLTLAGVYLLVIAGSAELVRSIGGRLADFAAWTLAFAALLAFALVALSEQVRGRLRVFVDRYLYEDRYDYRQQWVEFTSQLGASVRVDELLPRLATFVREATHVRHVAVLLASEHDGCLAIASQAGGSGGTVRIALEDWQRVPAIVDQENAPPPIAEALRALHLVLLVRMDGPHGAVGAIGTGSPVARAAFGDEDRTFLATIAAQAAATLVTARLSERLAASEQMEAVSRLATFVMHDLKNSAATLTMVAANAREHIGNAEFQQDALRAISSTADRIRRLIGKVSALPAGTSVDLSPIDLVDVARDAVDELQRARPAGVALRFRAGALPPVHADAAEVRKVLVNLVLNALEATSARGGAVDVATFADGGDACVEIRDSGTGIAQARLDAGLFTPFKSTKSGGLGIGLYQSKAIVDAHGGRIEVHSEAGRGSAFTVRLPLAASRLPAAAFALTEAETCQIAPS